MFIKRVQECSLHVCFACTNMDFPIHLNILTVPKFLLGTKSFINSPFNTVDTYNLFILKLKWEAMENLPGSIWFLHSCEMLHVEKNKQ